MADVKIHGVDLYHHDVDHDDERELSEDLRARAKEMKIRLNQYMIERSALLEKMRPRARSLYLARPKARLSDS